MQITAETPTGEYTIAKHKFTLFRPFAAGYVVTEAEANALNQTFAENVRNNFASKVKEHSDAGSFDQDALQAELNAYMDTYEFGVRKGRPAGGTGSGGRRADPASTRALELARAAVRKKIQEIGGNLKDYTAKDISARAAKAVESNPKFLETAIRQIAEENDIGDIDAGDLDSASISGEAKAKRAPKAAA